MTGLWLMPEQYGAGAAAAVRVAHERFPGPMRKDTDRWTEAFPHAVAFVRRLYAEERQPAQIRGAEE